MTIMKTIPLALVVLGFTALPAKAADILQGATPWILTDYPVPHVDTESCRTPSSSGASLRSCDPDGVFSDQEWHEIDQALLHTPHMRVCGDAEEESSVEVQIAVAITRKLNLQRYQGYEDPHSRATADFARGVHDAWGVGIPTRCGGTGILLFLSDLDRTVYISRGDALKQVLTDRRIDRVIENMKPFLQRQKYKDAVLHAVNEMVYLIHYGKPQLYERVTDFLARYSGLIWGALIFAFCYVNIRRTQAQRRQYAQAAAHLDEIERARAEALRGQYKIESCPICLETFPREGEAQPTIGSDGLPLKLLRCGHCFDESCWAEWVNTGRGQVDKCPICQQSVGRGVSEPSSTTNETEQGQASYEEAGERPGGARAPDPASANESPMEQERDTTQTQERFVMQQDDPVRRRAFQRYQHERNFRLARLAVRYPRFISQQQIQRWSSSTYDGPLVRDPTFVQNDPARSTAQASNNNSNSNNRSKTSQTGRTSSGGNSRVSNFGGGKSGGGRGSRW